MKQPSKSFNEIIPPGEDEKFASYASKLRALQKVKSKKYGNGRLLHRIAVERRSGTVTLDDLPPEVRAATHRPHLTAMEEHECEAIAKALSDADGNKLVAAKEAELLEI